MVNMHHDTCFLAGSLGASPRPSEHAQGLSEARHRLRTQERDGVPGCQPLQGPPQPSVGPDRTQVGCSHSLRRRSKAEPHRGVPQPQVQSFKCPGVFTESDLFPATFMHYLSYLCRKGSPSHCAWPKISPCSVFVWWVVSYLNAARRL